MTQTVLACDIDVGRPGSERYEYGSRSVFEEEDASLPVRDGRKMRRKTRNGVLAIVGPGGRRDERGMYTPNSTSTLTTQHPIQQPTIGDFAGISTFSL